MRRMVTVFLLFMIATFFINGCSMVSSGMMSVEISPRSEEIIDVPYGGKKAVDLNADVKGVVGGYFWRAVLSLRTDTGVLTLKEWEGYYPADRFLEIMELSYGEYYLSFLVKTPFMKEGKEYTSHFIINSLPKVVNPKVYKNGSPVEGKIVMYEPGMKLTFKWSSVDLDGEIMGRTFYMIYKPAGGSEERYEFILDGDIYEWSVPGPGELTWWVSVGDDRGGEYEMDKQKLYIY